MIKKQLISFIKFSVIWCLFNALIGGFNHFNERPKGVHQGAQCDRASIALNYYHNGLNLLYPEVHENRCKDGIVSCEFPLSNYLTAVVYKCLKYDEKYFRILTFLFVSIGMYALLLLLTLYIKTLAAYLLLFILNTSPILLFYASNFIPDASALGLSLAAWYLFFRLYIPHPYLPNVKKLGYVLFFILSITLAMASKTTCFIHWMTMMGVYILSHFKALKIELTNKKLLLSSLLFALILPIAWQLWARHLGKTHNSEFFILHIPLITDKAVYQNAWNVYIGNWPQETFTGPLQYVIGVLLFLPFFIKKYISNALWYITVLNTLGCFVFMAIMINQFMYHDYYILCLLPAVALNWLAIASAATKIKSNFWWVKIGIQSALPKPVDHILIQADNSAVAPGPLTPELASEMGTIADIESRGGATVYRFSEGSIRRGLDHGKTGDQIKTFLSKISKTPMPQPLEYLIADVAKRHGRLRVGTAHSYIRCEDEGLVQQILHDKKCEHLRLRKIAPQVLVTEFELTEVIGELREYGYLPAAENAGGVLLSQPNLRRAKSRPKPPRIISEFSAPKDAIVLSAVKTIRAGERSRKVEPIVAGTSSNETLALINQYISEGKTLMISYADNNGGVSNRIIDPISISLGTLTARDEASDEIVQFRIPRINGVAPALTVLGNKADLDL